MTALHEINADIWAPFSRSYALLDGELFAGILHDDHVRIISASASITGAEGYVAETEHGFGRARAAGDRLEIAFRFTERLASADRAAERGVYRVTIGARSGPEQRFFGRFRTIARRTAEGWRVLVDDDEGPATADDFDDARAVDDTTPFVATAG